jgi:hypothetical protein
MPVQRYEDGVFRIALRTCFPDGYVAHLPWAMAHEAEAGRRWARDDVVATARWLRTGELLVHCVRAYAPPPGAGPEARLRGLGVHLVALGALSAADFRAFVRARVVPQKDRYLAHLEGLVCEYDGAPRYWADDVRRHVAAMRAALETDAFFVPRDLVVSPQAAGPEGRYHVVPEPGPDERSLDEAQALAQRLVQGYGRLLAAWPDLVAATRALRARGVELAVPVDVG